MSNQNIAPIEKNKCPECGGELIPEPRIDMPGDFFCTRCCLAIHVDGNLVYDEDDEEDV